MGYVQEGYVAPSQDSVAEAYTDLVAAVMRLGLQDAANGFRSLMKLKMKNDEVAIGDLSDENHRQALYWMKSELQTPMSFEWCCAVFNLDPVIVRSKCPVCFNKEDRS